jgi:hypothetical protein
MRKSQKCEDLLPKVMVFPARQCDGRSDEERAKSSSGLQEILGHYPTAF